MTEKIVDYDAPPISEVVAAVGFRRIEEFKVPHFGLFWKKLPVEFSKTQQAPPNLRQPQLPINFDDVPVRCWFISQGERRLVQLQHDFFAFNWRRSDGDEPGDYPDFSKIYPEFERHFGALSDFVREHSLGSVQVTNFELTYVNIIHPAAFGRSLPVLSDVFRDHRYDTSDRYLEPPDEFNWLSRYPLAEHLGSLTVTASTARMTSDRSKKVIRLELSVKASPPPDYDRERWFLGAREAIVRGFADVTDGAVQQNIWRRKK